MLHNFLISIIEQKKARYDIILAPLRIKMSPPQEEPFPVIDGYSASSTDVINANMWNILKDYKHDTDYARSTTDVINAKTWAILKNYQDKDYATSSTDIIDAKSWNILKNYKHDTDYATSTTDIIGASSVQVLTTVNSSWDDYNTTASTTDVVEAQYYSYQSYEKE